MSRPIPAENRCSGKQQLWMWNASNCKLYSAGMPNPSKGTTGLINLFKDTIKWLPDVPVSSNIIAHQFYPNDTYNVILQNPVPPVLRHDS